MEKIYQLFIDESGLPNPQNKLDNLYILCGCSIAEDKKEKCKNLADDIKNKYWGRTNVVFHHAEIKNNHGEFAIFKNNQRLKNDFLKDLLEFLRNAPLFLLVAIIDLKLVKESTWNEDTVTKKSTHKLIECFVNFLFSDDSYKGKVITELSHTKKDKSFYDAFSYFMKSNLLKLDENYREKIKLKLTSLSFVTKKNFDIEEQISDLFTYAARRKFKRDKWGVISSKDSYDEKIINILEYKLLKTPLNIKRTHKEKYYKNIESFCILPK